MSKKRKTNCLIKHVSRCSDQDQGVAAGLSLVLDVVSRCWYLCDDNLRQVGPELCRRHYLCGCHSRLVRNWLDTAIP